MVECQHAPLVSGSRGSIRQSREYPAVAGWIVYIRWNRRRHYPEGTCLIDDFHDIRFVAPHGYHTEMPLYSRVVVECSIMRDVFIWPQILDGRWVLQLAVTGIAGFYAPQLDWSSISDVGSFMSHFTHVQQIAWTVTEEQRWSFLKRHALFFFWQVLTSPIRYIIH